MSRSVSLARLSRLGLLIALSAAGAHLKVPSITGTPAVDSAPGYFAALAFGPGEGALVAAFGHMLTALTAGFPLTLPLHSLISLGMSGCAACLAWISSRSGTMIAGIVTLLLNGIGLPAIFIFVPGFGARFFFAMVPPLMVASSVNLLISMMVYRALVRAGALKPKTLGG